MMKNVVLIVLGLAQLSTASSYGHGARSRLARYAGSSQSRYGRKSTKSNKRNSGKRNYGYRSPASKYSYSQRYHHPTYESEFVHEAEPVYNPETESAYGSESTDASVTTPVTDEEPVDTVTSVYASTPEPERTESAYGSKSSTAVTTPVTDEEPVDTTPVIDEDIIVTSVYASTPGTESAYDSNPTTTVTTPVTDESVDTPTNEESVDTTPTNEQPVDTTGTSGYAPTLEPERTESAYDSAPVTSPVTDEAPGDTTPVTDEEPVDTTDEDTIVTSVYASTPSTGSADDSEPSTTAVTTPVTDEAPVDTTPTDEEPVDTTGTSGYASTPEPAPTESAYDSEPSTTPMTDKEQPTDSTGTTPVTDDDPVGTAVYASFPDSVYGSKPTGTVTEPVDTAPVTDTPVTDDTTPVTNEEQATGSDEDSVDTTVTSFYASTPEHTESAYDSEPSTIPVTTSVTDEDPLDASADPTPDVTMGEPAYESYDSEVSEPVYAPERDNHYEHEADPESHYPAREPQYAPDVPAYHQAPEPAYQTPRSARSRNSYRPRRRYHQRRYGNGGY